MFLEKVKLTFLKNSHTYSFKKQKIIFKLLNKINPK